MFQLGVVGSHRMVSSANYLLVKTGSIATSPTMYIDIRHEEHEPIGQSLSTRLWQY